MPKSQLDWLGVASLWIGAAILALKSANLQLLAGAPQWLAADWWNYIPLLLITAFLILALYRQFRPVNKPRPVAGPVQFPPAKAMVDPDALQKRQEQNAIYILGNAHEDARRSLSDALPSARQRAAERQLPEMRAAMLSAHKILGTPMPPELKHAGLELEMHCRAIEQMLPYLKAGHMEEARERGQTLIDHLLSSDEEEKKA